MRAVLHAGLLDGELVLWAEGGDAEAAPPPASSVPARRRSGRAGGAPPLPPPWGLAAAAVAAALTEAVPGLDEAALRPVRVVAWLPSSGGRPWPSSPLLGQVVPAETAPRLEPWSIEALRLRTDAACAVLVHGTEREALAPGWILGTDFRFWSRALRLAAAIAARQMFLPGVSPDGRRAVWQPVLGGRSAEAADRLAREMPAACRALAASVSEEPPAVPARTVLHRFLGSVIDHLARDGAEALRPSFPSLHDQWLHALRAPDGTLRGSAGELAELERAVRQWAAPVHTRADAAWRLCLRLEEPQAGTSWYLRYLLQAADDPSLQVSAEDIWADSEAAAARTRRALAGKPAAPPTGVAALREALLAALGRAAALSPEVARSLETPRPSGCALDAAGAYTFLTESAWLLEQAGCVLQLPAWWTRGGGRARLAARATVGPKLRASAGLGLDAVVEFRWEVALGDQVLGREELEALAAAKSPLVRLRGQWVQVREEDLAAARALLAGRGVPRTGTLRDALRLHGGWGQAAGLPVAEVRGQGWVADLLQAGGEAPDAPPPPQGLRATLRPYQERGYAWLYRRTRCGLGACLADDMGLGKTVQTLALLVRDREEGASDPVLLVCPTSVVGNWLREAERFAPELSVLAHHGPDRLRGRAFAEAASRHALVVTTYALLPRDLETLQAVRWRGVVLDEAQNIKNAGTQQAQAARSLAAQYRIALTGTPVENSVGDLWSLMEFLNPGLLGSQAEFRRRFFLPIQVERDPAAAERLRRLVGPFVLRRVKTDPAVAPDLPTKQEMKVYCTLTREQASLYAAVLRDLDERLDEAEGIERRGLILATLTKLKQVCNHPAHLLGDRSALAGRSGKLSRLEEMLEEVLAAGERALVFTQFAEMGRLLQDRLREALGREVLFLHGGVPRAEREAMVRRFQDGGGDGPPVFVLSLRAGGTGLNLTAASHVFHFDRWWNPAVENQATDRAFRIGQTRHVQVHKFLCAGTVEERVDALIEGKREVAEKVIGSGEAWLTELSNAELRQLLALGPEAVAD